MSGSIIYTVGTALNRAHDNDTPVQILVEGQWLTGDVLAVDGHGVVLQSDALEHAVVRIDSVSAVRVFSEAPHRTPIQSVATPMAATARP
jgi:sRNA-binding regulator protein Hfq